MILNLKSGAEDVQYDIIFIQNNEYYITCVGRSLVIQYFWKSKNVLVALVSIKK